MVAEPVTLVAFGDSLTQGFGLPAPEGFVPKLETWLQDQGADVTLVNAGVSGDTTAGGLARIDWTLSSEADAMILALGGNDVLRGLPPAEAKANLDGILQKTQAQGIEVLLVGITVPGNFGPDYQTAFRALYPALADTYDTPLYPDFLAPITGIADRTQALRDYMQPDGIHPNAAGVDLVVAAMGPAVLELLGRLE